MFVKSIPPKMLHDQFGFYQGNWMPEMDRAWEDYERGYSVQSRMINTKQWGNVEHVTICRIYDDNDVHVATNGEMVITWAEKMQIKNELFGEDRFAIEIYPKQKFLVDVADVYHLWVFNKDYDSPFGIHPKEYKKAINRGATFYPEDMERLLEHMPEEKRAKMEKGFEFVTEDQLK